MGQTVSNKIIYNNQKDRIDRWRRHFENAWYPIRSEVASFIRNRYYLDIDLKNFSLGLWHLYERDKELHAFKGFPKDELGDLGLANYMVSKIEPNNHSLLSEDTNLLELLENIHNESIRKDLFDDFMNSYDFILSHSKILGITIPPEEMFQYILTSEQDNNAPTHHLFAQLVSQYIAFLHRSSKTKVFNYLNKRDKGVHWYHYLRLSVIPQKQSLARLASLPKFNFLLRKIVN
jgi:hypothetical protein